MTIASHIHPVDVHRHLPQIAELIEICFGETLDEDGREYIRQIRRAANEPGLVHWLEGYRERVSYPIFGYVWEENARVIGNISLIPFHRDNQWRYLIANVAVHPDFRQRGIGRLLTRQGMEHIRRLGCPSAWLQVREDNPVAHQLYLSMGFVERARRDTWLHDNRHIHPLQTSQGIEITPRQTHDWVFQAEWLVNTYPAQVSWNLNFSISRIKPGLFQSILNWFDEGDAFRNWAARKDGDLLGLATWESGRTYADNIWIGTNPKYEDIAIESLLAHIIENHDNHKRPYMVNYPARKAARAFETVGFQFLNRLIWMEVAFQSNKNHNEDFTYIE